MGVGAGAIEPTFTPGKSGEGVRLSSREFDREEVRSGFGTTPVGRDGTGGMGDVDEVCFCRDVIDDAEVEETLRLDRDPVTAPDFGGGAKEVEETDVRIRGRS